MGKKEIEKLYNELGWCKIDDLYHYSCLLTSGFDKEKAYDLKSLLNDLWLKDENNYSISKLSDMLYSAYNNIKDKIDDMTTREILVVIYKDHIEIDDLEDDEDYDDFNYDDDDDFRYDYDDYDFDDDLDDDNFED